MVINLEKAGNYKVMNAKLLLITVELPDQPSQKVPIDVIQ